MTCRDCQNIHMLTAYMRVQALQVQIAYMSGGATPDERIDQLKKLNEATEELMRAGKRTDGLS